MRITLNHITPLLAVGAAAIAIAAAPSAVAEQPCTNLGGSKTICQSPGNVQINDAPPAQSAPQYPFWAGSLLFHHGGHHG
jgi:hypothetical protein